MITKKEDLINTYVKNTPELRREFVSLAVKFGLIDGKSKICESSESAVVAYWSNVTGGHPTVGCWLAYADRIKEECRELTLSDLKPRTKTEFVKVEFDCASDAIKFQEGTGNFLAIKPNVIEVYEASGLHDVLKWYERGHTLYRKVEIEIDDQQEFVDRMLEMLDFNEAYDGNKIASDMYGNFGFRFKLEEK